MRFSVLEDWVDRDRPAQVAGLGQTKHFGPFVVVEIANMLNDELVSQGNRLKQIETSLAEIVAGLKALAERPELSSELRQLKEVVAASTAAVRLMETTIKP